MLKQNCTVVFVNLVNWRNKADIALPAEQRRKTPAGDPNGVPMTLQVDVEDDAGTRYRGFFHRGPKLIAETDQGQFGGKAMDFKVIEMVKGSTPNQSANPADMLGVVGDARIAWDQNPVTGEWEGEKDLVWFSLPKTGVGAALEGLTSLEPIAAVAEQPSAPTTAPAEAALP
jgi:hypothetical protein